jgi:hypothetical protein
MSVAQQIAKHLRDVHFGGNWTTSNMKDNLAGVTWEQATKQVHSFNTIVTLVYHTHYYVEAIIKVLQGEALNAKDELSFDHPPIASEQDWQNLLDKVWDDANMLASLIEQLPDSKLDENFTDAKYGTYYRNLQGMIEHTHYHLGQIVIIKKML